MKTGLKREELGEIMRKGKRIVGENMVIMCGRGKREGKRERYAVIIPKKIMKRSVDRNRVRRIMRELLRESGMGLGSFAVKYTGKSRAYGEIKIYLDTVRKKVGYTVDTGKI